MTMQLENNIRLYDINDIAGVVVLFEPDNVVIENILSYLYQINLLFIIDNSENSSPIILDFIKNNNTIEYIFNSKNLGVATALNIGAKKAMEYGYAFLLTMDQDSKAPPGLVQSLVEVMQKSNDIGIVSPLHSNRYNIYNTKTKFDFSIVMTSGNLLRLDAYKKTGDYCDDFFIDYIDIEYCIRLNINNYRVIQLKEIVLQHNEANLSVKKFFRKKYYPQNHAPFRMYYKTRNLFFLRDMYKSTYPALLLHEYNLYLRILLKIILFEKQKYLKFKMILLGIWDYIRGKKNKKF
jgi:rhamnosyltransferase